MHRYQLTATEAQRWIAEYIRGSDNPDFRHYGSSLLRSMEAGTADRFIWFVRYLMRLGGMFEARVLDVGCGFGWYGLAISILGNNHVVANDIRETMTGPLRERIAAVRRKGAPVSVEALTGDICALSIAPRSFDAIVCNEMIEHVHDLDAMLDVCFSILRPGGRCVITNDNNALNRKHLTEIRKMWEQRDRAWEFIEKLKRERPIENQDIEPYAVSRDRIVRRSNPKLIDEEVAAVVAATAGMIEQEIVEVALSFADRLDLPTPPEYSWCRNPLTGEFCERQLDPFEVAEMMAARGFKTRVRHAFRRLPLRLLYGVTIRPLAKRLFSLRPIFVLVGRKPFTAV